MPCSVRLDSFGTSLISRARGAAAREHVLAIAATASEPVVLDFEGVAHASYSFIDELVGKLATGLRSQETPRALEIVNTNAGIDRHVAACLSRREPAAGA